MVLVDEGQDLSPIILDALEHCQKRIIIVGDTHHQIYSFHYAIDAMKRSPFDNERDLTMSFCTTSLSRPGRPSASEFGEEANIAYVAFTRAIRELYLPQDFKEILTPE